MEVFGYARIGGEVWVKLGSLDSQKGAACSLHKVRSQGIPRAGPPEMSMFPRSAAIVARIVRLYHGTRVSSQRDCRGDHMRRE